ncbi:MAG: hypothetical protein KAX87_01345 [Nitrospira sp.]|nr:hypothetical protein [Nitrospira sp.]
MAEEQDSVFTALYEFFLQEFRKGRPDSQSDPSEVVFAFEQFPVSVMPEDYLLNPQDPASFSQTKLDEMFSRMLTDNPPVVSGNYRLPASDSISESYFYEVVGPAQFVSNPQATAQTNEDAAGWFSTLKAKAKSEFKTVVSVMGVAEEFAPSDALPDGWLDPRHNELWRKYSFTAKDQPAVPSSSPGLVSRPIRLGLAWRTLDERIVGTKIKTLTDDGTDNPPPVGASSDSGGTPRARPGAPMSMRPIVSSLAVGRASAPVPAPGSPVPPATFLRTPGLFSAGVRTPAMIRVADSLSAKNKVAGSLKDAVPVVRNARLMQLLQGAPRQVGWAKPLSLRDRIVLRDEMAHTLSEAVVETKPTVTHVRVDFEYQIIRVSRPWLFYPFLRYPQWYIPGLKRGALADAGTTDPTGRLALIPVALIAIRNLSIEANWSEADVARLSTAFAIGPFGRGQKAEIVGQSLKCDGVQILGCISERMPMLPPQSDPSLT